MIEEIIKKVHQLTPEQQKKILETLNSIQASDKRKYPRRKIKIEIDAVVGDKSIKSDTRDISGSGMFISTALIANIDTGVQVVFSLPEQDRPFKLKGKIKRLEPSGIGIQFDEVNPCFQKILDKVIWGSRHRD